MKLRLVTTIALLISIAAMAQKKSRGDRYFKNGDYLNAITEYKKQLNNKEYTKHIFENISTAYYNTFQYRKAYRTLRSLLKGKFQGTDKTYDNEFNFKMHQVLSALGEYDKAVEFLALYKKNETDGVFDKQEAISIIEAFKLKDEDYKIKNDKSLNTASAEFGAVKKDSMLYFVSDRSPNGIEGVLNKFNKTYRWTHRPFLDIYQVSVDSLNKPVSEVTPFSKTINSSLHEGNFCFSKDGNTLYFSKSNAERGRKKFDTIRNNAIHLYRSVLSDSLKVWSKPEKLPFNNVNYSVEHPSLSPDGKKLYFASNMPGGYGDFDLYYVDITGENTFGVPVNLGQVVNTASRDQFPYINEQGNLFFSSNGHLGLGMMDIFVSEKVSENFTKPINLGAPINSSYDDFSLTYSNETEGYFASNRKKTDDIYRFTQIGEIYLRKYKAKFEVRDVETKEFVENVEVSLWNKEEVYNKILTNTAEFSLSIFPGKYTFKASAEGYESQTKPILIQEKANKIYVIYLQKKVLTVAEVKKKKAEVNSPKVIKSQLINDKVGPPVTERNGKLYFDLPPIYFDYDKWNIRADSKKVLEEFALKLEKYKSVYIKISSHTDSRGTKTYNQLLSEKRAESTRNYLALVGYVNARRMQFEGFGESVPLISCDGKVCSEEEHQTNRRSEFEIIKY
ncbi:OmpA family protein [Aquimarina agarivorans]|uniref:OmpA family protein n=1 Tax=Aquimarina agarivorans TaxID=980584 RepID=UPI000248EA9A|nr:OmpA family protein [Aquimarina agarivorans]